MKSRREFKTFLRRYMKGYMKAPKLYEYPLVFNE